MSSGLGLGDLFIQLENIFKEMKNHADMRAILTTAVNAIADIPAAVVEVTTNPIAAGVEAVTTVAANISEVTNTGTEDVAAVDNTTTVAPAATATTY